VTVPTASSFLISSCGSPSAILLLLLHKDSTVLYSSSRHTYTAVLLT